jgi:alpha(1,3/1,4) fucosyltransferase
MKKKIKINFSDWWPGFNPIDNYFYNLLKEEFDIEISSNPDYLFYSVFGNSHQNFRGTKISYIGENIAPVFKDQTPNGADWSFSFDYLDDVRNYRLPHYLLYPGYYNLINEKKIEDWMANRKFCSFLVSNGNCKLRNDFFIKLSKYKKVDSGGRHYNNIGFLVNDKLDFLRNYKFNICFENDAHRGYNEHYTTEKLMQSMQANTIGIYHGNTQIEKEFNKKSFIDVRDFSNLDEVVEYIIELDKNNDKYLDILKTSVLVDNIIPDNNKEENIKYFLYKIFLN